MVIFLLLLCALCILPVCSIFEVTCPRKDPPPGVLVVTPGSRLVLTCGGDVTVNEAKVVLSGAGGNEKKPTSARAPTTAWAPSIRTASASLPDGESHLPPDAEAGVGSPQTARPTRLTAGEPDREDEEGQEGGSRVTRGVKARHQWKRSKLPGQKGDRGEGGIEVVGDEVVLSLASVTPTDAGRYSCHRRGKETFAVKVLVADPPETPTLSCYKKSPSSKIRCEWRPQNTVREGSFLHFSLSKTKERIPCSYSSQHSMCWCTGESAEDERRTLHVASLCVTSILGNATSPPMFFSPLDILKPDPPSNVSARQVEGSERRIRVTWNMPLSWKQQDEFYDIVYEIRYRPLTSTYEQVNEVKGRRSYTITDALPGEEYLIQLRTTEEYDGHWSEWSSPVYARSWMGKYQRLPHIFKSSLYTSPENDPCLNSEGRWKTPHYVFWISGVFALSSIVLAFYIFRHRDKFLSKFHRLSVVTWSGDLSPPSFPVPADRKGKTLVTQPYKECPPRYVHEEEENEEEQTVTGGVEAMNFNNTTYFFLQNEL
uniref:Interleukin 6 receptor n=1 Tax=Kryptolebias marmoratus TaxID=37003 RepID=A0A3Q2ZJX9_KRYMA